MYRSVLDCRVLAHPSDLSTNTKLSSLFKFSSHILDHRLSNWSCSDKSDNLGCILVTSEEKLATRAFALRLDTYFFLLFELIILKELLVKSCYFTKLFTFFFNPSENMPELQRIIRVAMDDWESKTCVKFVPRKDEEKVTDYVTFFRGSQ